MYAVHVLVLNCQPQNTANNAFTATSTLYTAANACSNTRTRKVKQRNTTLNYAMTITVPSLRHVADLTSLSQTPQQYDVAQRS